MVIQFQLILSNYFIVIESPERSIHILHLNSKFIGMGFMSRTYFKIRFKNSFEKKI